MFTIFFRGANSPILITCDAAAGPVVHRKAGVMTTGLPGSWPSLVGTTLPLMTKKPGMQLLWPMVSVTITPIL
jgi:hypothetical protein